MSRVSCRFPAGCSGFYAATETAAQTATAATAATDTVYAATAAAETIQTATDTTAAVSAGAIASDSDSSSTAVTAVEPTAFITNGFATIYATAAVGAAAARSITVSFSLTG